VVFAGQDISASKPIQRIGIRTRNVTAGIAVIQKPLTVLSNIASSPYIRPC